MPEVCFALHQNMMFNLTKNIRQVRECFGLNQEIADSLADTHYLTLKNFSNDLLTFAANDIETRSINDIVLRVPVFYGLIKSGLLELPEPFSPSREEYGAVLYEAVFDVGHVPGLEIGIYSGQKFFFTKDNPVSEYRDRYYEIVRTTFANNITSFTGTLKTIWNDIICSTCIPHLNLQEWLCKGTAVYVAGCETGTTSESDIQTTLVVYPASIIPGSVDLSQNYIPKVCDCFHITSNKIVDYPTILPSIAKKLCQGSFFAINIMQPRSFPAEIRGTIYSKDFRSFALRDMLVAHATIQDLMLKQLFIKTIRPRLNENSYRNFCYICGRKVFENAKHPGLSIRTCPNCENI